MIWATEIGFIHAEFYLQNYAWSKTTNNCLYAIATPG